MGFFSRNKSSFILFFPSQSLATTQIYGTQLQENVIWLSPTVKINGGLKIVGGVKKGVRSFSRQTLSSY